MGKGRSLKLVGIREFKVKSRPRIANYNGDVRIVGCHYAMNQFGRVILTSVQGGIRQGFLYGYEHVDPVALVDTVRLDELHDLVPGRRDRRENARKVELSRNRWQRSL
jgi:hypothetical protein